MMQLFRRLAKAAKVSLAAALAGNLALPMGAFSMASLYVFECHGADGRLKWREEVPNLVVNVGLNDLLDKYFKGSSYTAAHYVGLTTGSPTFASGDTMSSHGGWTESTVYSNSTRPAFTPGTVASQSVDNSASAAVFTINSSGTVGGGFLVTNSTKGGTTGTLYGGAAFSGGNRTVDNGDTLTVTVTATAAAA